MRLLALAIVMLATPAWAQSPLQLEGSAAPSPWQRYPGWNKTLWNNYNTLANPRATPPHAGEIAIKEITGDPAKGQQLAFDRNRGGGCLACHVMGPKTPETPGMSDRTCRRSAKRAAPTSGCTTMCSMRGSTIRSR